MARANAEENAPALGFDATRVAAVFYRYLTTANPTIFVAELGRELIGFLNARICEYEHTAGFFTAQHVLYVKPAWRGTRAAAAASLLDRFVTWSAELGAKEIVGGSDTGVRSESTAKLLSRFGFERVGYSMRRSL